MRKLIFPLLIGIAGLIVGAIAALVYFKQPSASADVAVGAWHANLAAGSRSADMFSRASVATSGLLALNRSETVYFVAAHDDSGAALTGACRYDVMGQFPAARWWSITLYGEDLFLVGNSASRFSFNQANVTRDAGGGFHLAVASAQQQGDWLPAPAGGNFLLVLRLYNPDAALAANPQSLVPPKIAPRGDCTGGEKR
jgi:hypothetical protein